MKTAAAGLLVLLHITAGQARAQPQSENRPSLNLSAGIVGSTERLMPGGVLQILVGTDVPLTERWSVRFEAGGRLPRHKQGVTGNIYALPSAEDPGTLVSALSRIEITKTTLMDLSALFRRSWPRGPAEIAALAGIGLSTVRFDSIHTIPLSLSDTSRVDVFTHTNTRTLSVFDFGIEAGWRATDRWTVLVQGIAGLQPPLEEHRRPELRAGVMLKRRF